jgi:hypothetical protein
VTCAALVNELVEAADDRVLSRVVGRYGRLELLCLDELGYVSVLRLFSYTGSDRFRTAGPEFSYTHSGLVVHLEVA